MVIEILVAGADAAVGDARELLCIIKPVMGHRRGGCFGGLLDIVPLQDGNLGLGREGLEVIELRVARTGPELERSGAGRKGSVTGDD